MDKTVEELRKTALNLKGLLNDEYERRIPHWITHNVGNPFEIYGECSECGFKQSISDKLNYCPNCGKKMDHGYYMKEVYKQITSQEERTNIKVKDEDGFLSLEEILRRD